MSGVTYQDFPTSIKLDEKTLKSFGLDGNGTKEKPFLLDDLTDIPLEIQIFETNLYLEIINIDLSLHYLIIFNSQNITVKNCTLGVCDIGWSSQITIDECKVKTRIELSTCKDILVSNANIEHFSLVRCYNIFVKDSILKFLDLHQSRGNIFKNTTMPIDFNNESILNLKISLFTIYLPKVITLGFAIGFLIFIIFVFFLLQTFITIEYSWIIISIIIITMIFVTSPIWFPLLKFKKREPGNFSLKYIRHLPPNELRK